MSRRRRDALLMLGGLAVLLLVGLGDRDLWNPNEPAYGPAVAEMARGGEWLVPTLNGRAFSDKPILYFWMARATSALLGGPHELALRLPVAAAALATAWMLYVWILPYAGRRRAILATVLFATIFAWWWSARQIQMDTLVAASTVGVLFAVTRVLDHGYSPRAGWLWAGLAAGLGLLAKGPVALILPGLAYVAYAASTGRIREAFPRAALAGGILALAVSGSWFGGLFLAGREDVLHEVLIRQNFSRFVEAWDHREPWWYYLAYVWLDMVPWVLWVPLAAGLPDRSEGERRLDRLAWSLLMVVIAFFSLSDSKRSAYILPVAPAIAILAAGVGERFLNGRLGLARERAARAIGALAFAGLAAVAVAVLGYDVPGLPEIGRAARFVAIVLLGGSLCALGGFLFRRIPRVWTGAAAVGTVAATYLAAAAWLLPAANALKSVRPFCEQVLALESRGDRIVSYRLSFLRGGYSYYLGRAVPDLEDAGRLRQARDAPGRLLVITEDDMEEGAAAAFGAGPVLRRRVGSNEALLFVESDRNGNRAE